MVNAVHGLGKRIDAGAHRSLTLIGGNGGDIGTEERGVGGALDGDDAGARRVARDERVAAGLVGIVRVGDIARNHLRSLRGGQQGLLGYAEGGSQ